MSTLFKSQELWELVKNGFPDPKPAEPDQALQDNRKKDAKALFFIQSALDDNIFPRIASSSTFNQAWEILKQEFFGDRKPMKIDLAEDEEEEDSMDKVVVECKNYKKPGHKESECWFKPKEYQHASFMEKKNEKILFMTHIHDGFVPNDFGFINSGCSSHMCRSCSLFMDLDTSEKSMVRLGDDRQVHIERKGSVAINTTTSKKKVFHDVLFVPKLAHNLIVKVGMTTNQMFPLDGSSVKEKVIVVTTWKDSDIWHLHHGHLHLNGMKLLKNKDMVMGLPNIDDLEFCEGCVLGK
ncbi:retrovirus-related pol polyprotein from transposon TNT 1-94 [Tanacetum coccineum]